MQRSKITKKCKCKEGKCLRYSFVLSSITFAVSRRLEANDRAIKLK